MFITIVTLLISLNKSMEFEPVNVYLPEFDV